MEQFIHLVCEMAPYLLLGFLLAGLMHAFIPKQFYARYLSKKSWRSVINAAILGIPLPLCSCGVIPTAMSLRKEGASKGAVVSFLIATPQTGVDSIIATYGLMGLPFAIIRPIAALVTALFGGVVSLADDTPAADCEVEDKCDCNGHGHSHGHNHSHAHNHAHTGFLGKIKEALEYAFVEMMEDIGKWLVVGLVVAGLITIYVPTEWFTAIQGNTWASMLLVLCIAIPMYVCATGSIPIAVALMLKGITPGAALVLLMAGPACNLASVLVVRKVLGTKTMVLYLLSIIVGSVAFGSIVDYLQYNGMVDFVGQLIAKDACCVEGNSWFSIASGILLLVLLVNALLIQPGIAHRHTSEQIQTNQNTTNMKTYHIEGMNCNHCRMAAEKAILSVEGVTSASVNLQAKEAQVEGTATDEAICKAVEEVGFKCTC